RGTAQGEVVVGCPGPGSTLDRAEEKAAAQARSDRFRQAADQEGTLRIEGGEGRRALVPVEDAAVDLVLDDAHPIVARDGHDLVAPPGGHDAAGRIVQGRDVEKQGWRPFPA